MSYFEEKDVEELREAVKLAMKLHQRRAVAFIANQLAWTKLQAAKKEKNRCNQSYLAIANSHFEACERITALETKAAQIGKIVEFTESITP
jgi:hypothetical protein